MAVIPRRWKRTEYERLVELGVFAGEPIELIDGLLVVAEPQGSHHVAGIVKTDYTVRAALPPGWIVRVQAPIALDDDSEPEPDLAVVPGAPGDHADGHPRRPALVIEVSESRLEADRIHKGSLYARGGIEDYWIVNLVDHVLEVYREPAPDASAPYGWRYRSTQRLPPSATVRPLAIPATAIAVADLLP
jgi:Uma2 family endonuclease